MATIRKKKIKINGSGLKGVKIMNYFRITGYVPQDNYCFIIDSNGFYEKLWQFSSFLVQKGIKIVEVSNIDKIIDINIKPAKLDNNHIILRAIAKGKPEYINQTTNGSTYKAIKVADKIYIPNNYIVI